MVCPLILEKQVLLGILIDYELKFDDHVNYLRKKQVKNLMPVLHLLQMLAKHELSWSHLMNRTLVTVL